MFPRVWNQRVGYENIHTLRLTIDRDAFIRLLQECFPRFGQIVQPWRDMALLKRLSILVRALL